MLQAQCPFPTYATEKAKSGFTLLMEHKGFRARLMRAPRLRNNGTPHGLPPGIPVAVFPVDALPGCPEDWIRGPGSFVCPVEAETCGLWFSFTENDDLNTAVLMSVKGMNPITGQKLEGLSLEKYVENCPVHKEPFKSGLFCEKCDYKWPEQSYVSYPNVLWWDGFRQADGTVRQFFFSEDEARDIASAVIGKQNTVPAFGFAFFQPVKRRERPRPTSPLRGAGGQSVGLCGFVGSGIPQSYPYAINQGINQGISQPSGSHEYLGNCGHEGSFALDADFVTEPEVKTSGQILMSSDPRGGQHVNKVQRRILCGPEVPPPPAAIKAVSVGAGAEIRQNLVSDPLNVTDWKSEASSIIRLYFVFEPQFKQIFDKGGLKDLDGSKEGFMKGLPVG